MDTIKNPVGLSAANEPKDVHLVQKLLNRNRHRIPDMRELDEDCVLGPRTLGAIGAFQTIVLKFRNVDHVVEPGGKTWKALVSGARGRHTAAPQVPPLAPGEAPALDEPISFPLRNRNVPDYRVPRRAHEHHRYFGAPRKTKDGGFRAHAGCDLVAPDGTSVLAVDDGEVLLHEPGFFDVTDALQVAHDNGLVVRYGEIRATAGLTRVGTQVRRGQVIGQIVRNTKGTAMLHIELYAGTEQGSLSRAGNVFRRRSDLVNPTRYLDEAASATA